MCDLQRRNCAWTVCGKLVTFVVLWTLVSAHLARVPDWPLVCLRAQTPADVEGCSRSMWRL